MADQEAAKKPTYTVRSGGADPTATKLVTELKHDRGILACRYAPNGDYLYAGARDYLVHRWDLSAEPEVEPPADPKKKSKTPPVPAAPALSRVELGGHESWVQAIACRGDGERMVTGDFVGRVIIWKLADQPQPLHSIAAHEGMVRKVAVSPDGELIATAGNDGAVRLWSTGDGTLRRELLGHDCHVYNVAFHPDGKSLVSADLKCRLLHWDAATGKLKRELSAAPLYTYSVKYEVHVGGVRGMSFNGDGSLLACAGATGEKGIAHSGNARVLLIDWATGEIARELKPEKEEICTAWGVQFHPDGFIVSSGGSRTGGFLWFWTADEDVAFHSVRFKQRAPGFDLDIAPDNKRLAVANHDGVIRLYSMTPEPPVSAE
ncbi:MAG: WD40 repeat domain-containing protein [Pirellulaceae bacterium]|nr:WD40 repeat domain-containing protein [Pirellulaceae bacterium]MDP7014508.1 WD40 repeat domain-containing protein [Pirellulaceae bacterium]